MWCWSGGRGILTELSLCYSIVYHYSGAQCYEQFLQVSPLDQSGFDLAWFSSLSSECLCVFGLHGAMYYVFTLPCSELAWCDWPVTWLTNHHPSVLGHCWLGHFSCKIIPEMTYNRKSCYTILCYTVVLMCCAVQCWLVRLETWVLPWNNWTSSTAAVCLDSLTDWLTVALCSSV